MAGVPLHPDEIVYRRIPFDYYPRPKQEPFPMIVAFRPTENDITGLSLSREKHKTIEKVAKGWPGKRYHVARMLVRDLNEIGLTVIADDLENNPSHAVIPELRREVYKANTEACQNIANTIITSIAEIVLVALDPDEYPDLQPSGMRDC